MATELMIKGITYQKVTPVTVSDSTSELDHFIRFQKDVEILSVFVEKASAGSSTLDVDILPDGPNDGPDIVLGSLSLGATDTTAMYTDRTPLSAKGGLRVVTTNLGATKKAVTIYVRALAKGDR